MSTSSSTGARWGRSIGRPYSRASLSTILSSLRRSAIAREGYAGWYDPTVEIAERHADVAGLETHWRQAGEAPILYVHGVPTDSWDWEPFLVRTGGVAPDLPGFGNSAKPGDFDYSIAGYDRFLEAFCAQAGLERFSLVVHDWGGVALALAQRFPERIDRLVLFSTVPLLPGFRWHRVARAWRTPLVGELTMGFTTRWGFRRSLVLVFLAMVALGGALELIQMLVGRDGEWGDFLANDLGALAGLGLAALYLAMPRRLVAHHLVEGAGHD